MRLPFALARRFVAGESLDAALPALGALLDDGLFVTLDLLGEHVRERERAEHFTGEYVRLVEAIAAWRGERDVSVSVKLSMMGQVIDEALCEANARRLLDAARDTGTFVRLDMEGSGLTASSLRLFEALRPDYPDHVGPVLQAYLHRTAGDVERMCELDARVRLCKGAYGEGEAVATRHMPEIRERFVAAARRLLEGARYPGIATHDDALIEATKTFVAERGIARDAFEFQMLYGLRPQTQTQLVRDGYRMRVYVPFGTEWLPYFSRRLRERRENVLFVLKNLVRA